MSGFAEELLTRFRWIGGHADVLGLLSDAGFLARSVAALTPATFDQLPTNPVPE